MPFQAHVDIFGQRSSAREDMGFLAVMDAISESDRASQRELARVTGLNLKKVNHCLHKLVEKGYVKFQRVRSNPDKRSYLYILTPTGLRAKSQLTYRFLKLTLSFYNEMESKLRVCLSKMEDSGVRRLALYGATDVARILLDMLANSPIELVAVVDEALAGSDFHGIGVLRELDAAAADGIVITSLEGIDKTIDGLLTKGFPEEVIWTLS